ncbi:hypothetical protein MMC24_007979, partial [Lignoscripta atroalba]|nr:hypothetical protein [Lignoscripta atroalba]
MKQSRPTKSFTLHLDRSKMTRFSELLNQHIENHITYNGLRMPDEDMTAEKDPHAFPTDEFIFTYTLQTVNDDEDEYSYEYDGPLLALQDEFQVTADNDIALLNKPVTIAEDIKMNIPSGHHDENTELNIPSGHHDDDTEMDTSSRHHDDDTEMDITSEHLNEEALTDEQQKIQDFLSSEMLRYHDGYDVSTPEGLLAWQHYALDKVAGNMLRLTKEKSIMKLFKEAHAEIQKAQTDSELAALSIDINGAVFMLQRTLRKILLTDKFTNQLKMQEIVKELESIKTSAGILIDIMGFRKTGKDIADSDKGFIEGSDQAESDTSYDGSEYEENDAVSLKSEDSDESSDSALSVEGAAEGAVESCTEFTLKSIMMKLLRQNYVKLTVKQQEHLNPDRVYTLKDLKDTVILDRALRLLYQAHFDKERQQLCISPHINYSKLLKKVSQMIKNKYHMKEAQLQTAVKALAATMNLMNVKTVNRVVAKKEHHKDEQAPSDKYEDTTAEEGRGDEPAGDDTTAEEGSEVSVNKDADEGYIPSDKNEDDDAEAGSNE